MNRLVFQTEPPPPAPAPNRADVALFVGLVGRRATPLPPPLRRWLSEQGLPTAENLADVPVPVDSWDVFDRLFAWDRRPLAERGTCDTYLGAAIRSFFAQGGRRCFVVRAGNPLPVVGPSRAARLEQLARLVPWFDPRYDPPSPHDRSAWHGVGHLFGLPEVSFLCLPDLPELAGLEHGPPPDPPPVKEPPEEFVECGVAEPTPIEKPVRGIPAARCGVAEYLDWSRAVRLVGGWLARSRREVQLVAAVPMPSADARDPLLDMLIAAEALPGDREDGAAAFVQLAYPWVRTPGSANLPEGLESPDGPLVGLLARNALLRGAFRSAARQPVGDVHDVWPLLSRADTDARPGKATAPALGLGERVSLFGPTPGGLTLLSDVTTSADDARRPASVRRLVAVLLRAARRVGEEVAFEPSGEQLWAAVRRQMAGLLEGLFRAGALGGETAEEAFDVRCDRSTMTQHDLDGGRAVVRVAFTPALPVERITVVLGLSEGGVVALPAAGQKGAA